VRVGGAWLGHLPRVRAVCGAEALGGLSDGVCASLPHVAHCRQGVAASTASQRQNASLEPPRARTTPTTTHRGIIIPPLPEKNAVQKFTMGSDFIEERRRALQVFVNRVAAHPVLKASREVQRFLESNEDEFAFEVARTQAVRA